MMDFVSTPASLKPRFLTRAGCPLRYWLGGPLGRPLLVFLHGAAMDHRMFNAQIDAFVTDYRVLVWDARGHGASQPIGADISIDVCVADLLAVLDELQVEQAVFCGQSMGGFIAQRLYLTAPERVRALILIGSTPIAKAYSKTEIRTLRATLGVFRFWPYRHLVRLIARNTAVTPAAQAYARDATSEIDHVDFLRIWRAVTLAVGSTGIENAAFRVPLLLLHGANDRTGTVERDVPEWARTEPHATYHEIPDAGHNANQDAPEFTNRVIAEFLQETVERKPDPRASVDGFHDGRADP